MLFPLLWIMISDDVRVHPLNDRLIPTDGLSEIVRTYSTYPTLHYLLPSQPTYLPFIPA